MRLNGINPVVAIVQARMGSTRLPGKVLKEICGKTVLWHVVNRLRAARNIDSVLIATTTEASDDPVVSWCRENRVAHFRGSLDDVLDRYYRAAGFCGARTIVRITADCPLIEPTLVDRVIEKFAADGCDHAGVASSFPDGLDAEVFSFEALKKAHAEARLASEREHVTPYIWKNPQTFRLGAVHSETDLSKMRWTVDDEKDFRFVTKVFEGLGAGRVFHMDDVLEFLRKNPELLEINSQTMRNEGYAKSLKEDKVVGI